MGAQHPHWLLFASVAFAIIVCVCGLSAAITWATRRWWTGGLILKAGRPLSRPMIAILLFYFAIWLYAVVITPHSYALLFNTIVIVSIATALYLARVLEVRERGIFYESRLISWRRIVSWDWEWQYAQAGFAILNLELKRRSFFRRSIRIQVQRSVVDGVSQALQAHVPASG